MKCRLIVDSEATIHPDYKPPVRSQFATHEEFHDAKAIYDVDHSPHGGFIPAGTEISELLAWVLCYFDESGMAIEVDTVKGTRTPVKISAGVIKAEPIDEACQAMLTLHCRHVATMRKVPLQTVLDEVAKGVKASKDRQARADQLKAKEAGNVGQ